MPDKFPDLGVLPDGPERKVLCLILPLDALKDDFYKSISKQNNTFFYILAYADHTNPDKPRGYIRVHKNNCLKWLQDIQKSDTKKVFLRIETWTENGINFTRLLWSRAES